jgi:BASS family bile acid:Na+ symporter
MPDVDAVQIQFSAQSLRVLNLSLAFIMFGVALQLTVDNFRQLARRPRPALIGVVSQFFVLPLLTFLLVLALQPTPSIALGMILVASCPGGNISNFMSMNANGNVALSVTLTAISTVAAILFTPVNLAFWGGLYAPAEPILRAVDVSFWTVFKTVALILGLPLIGGMAVRHWAEAAAQRISRVMQGLSIAIFAVIVLVALMNNYASLIGYLGAVFGLVLVHNATALSAGYLLGTAAGLPIRDRRTLAIETGIQNSGLGLILIFNFFGGLGGMALVAGWWGIWHIVSGLGLSFFWQRQPIPALSAEPS